MDCPFSRNTAFDSLEDASVRCILPGKDGNKQCAVVISFCWQTTCYSWFYYILCTDNCTEGAIRLAGRSTPTSGRGGSVCRSTTGAL